MKGSSSTLPSPPLLKRRYSRRNSGPSSTTSVRGAPGSGSAAASLPREGLPCSRWSRVVPGSLVTGAGS
eukprot:scaffold41294_cov42-Phaeocystis_antarctica.AAC.1